MKTTAPTLPSAWAQASDAAARATSSGSVVMLVKIGSVSCGPDLA